MRYLITILVILNSLSNINAQVQAYKNLVFEGAGIRGIAYSGVIKELEKQGILSQIENVGGTSAGAITAMALALGYSADEIYSIISETGFQKFNDPGLSGIKGKMGWYKGDEMKEWLEGLIENKTGNKDITLSQLEKQGFKALSVTATCMNKQRLVVLSSENYPEMKVSDAVRISMSIPIYFEPVLIDEKGKVYKRDKKGKDLDIMVDGGILGNYPIFIFDSIAKNADGQIRRIANPATLGVRIDTPDQIEYDELGQQLAPVEIEKFSEFLEAFFVLVLENLNRNSLIEEDWERTISVSSVGIGPKIKKLSDEEKLRLMRSGEESTQKFLRY